MEIELQIIEQKSSQCQHNIVIKLKPNAREYFEVRDLL